MNNDGPQPPTDTEDHDQVMAHFQEITNFYDMEQCLAILESTQWNLDQAIQSFYNGGGITEQMDEDIVEIDRVQPVIPDVGTSIQTSSFSLNNRMTHTTVRNVNNDSLGIFGTSITSISSQISPVMSNNLFDSVFPSNSVVEEFTKKPTRLINLNIEYFQKNFTLHMPDNETVYSLKELIAQEIGLPVSSQKLKGWKNKDIKVTDSMQLRELNLPLENNLFVINTNDKGQDVDHALFGENNVKIDSFELDIQILKSSNTNARSNISIVNSSTSVEGANLASYLAREAFPTPKESNIQNRIVLKSSLFQYRHLISQGINYHLHFEPNIRFIEMKRKIAMLTNISASEQEWWLFVSKPQKNVDEEVSLEAYIESGALFNMPLTILIESDMKLIDIKNLLDNLTETNTNVSSTGGPSSLPSGKSVFPDSFNPSQNNDSKLTPLVAKPTVLKMAFLITQKKESSKSFDTPAEETKAGKSNHSTDKEIEEIHEEDDSHCDLSVDDEDLDENFMMDSTPKHKALIPATVPVGDEQIGTTMFIEEFFKRYQPLIPIFFNGPLEDSIKEALGCPARDRKLLGIYLHSDNSVCRHIFCSKTLCDENVVNFLAANFVVWPWDLTNKEHETHFYASCSKHLGSVVTSHLRTNKIEFPAFLVVNRTRGTNEVVAVIEGTASSDTMMHRLMQTFEMFEGQRLSDMRDESEREMREQIKRDQDMAYQASLEVDKAKRQKQDEEQERVKQLAKREEDEEKRKEGERKNKIQRALNRLPDEPVESVDQKCVSRIRFRLPNGEFLQRKFLIEHKLESLFDFLTSNGYFIEEFKVLSSWPRLDLTKEPVEKTIETLKLYPQETLTLEER